MSTVRKIRIVKTPPGFAQVSIRMQWVGIVIPLAPEEEAKEAEADMDPSSKSAGGYIVRGTDACTALLNAGRTAAASYWGMPVPPKHMRFARDCCELI